MVAATKDRKLVGHWRRQWNGVRTCHEYYEFHHAYTLIVPRCRHGVQGEFGKPSGFNTFEVFRHWQFSQLHRALGHFWSMLRILDSFQSPRAYREALDILTLRGLSIGHQKKIKIILHKVFMFGIETGQIKGIGQSPVFGFQFPKEEETKPEILTIHEIRQLLKMAKELSHPWFSVWSMALLTGMRNGELYALKWRDVDFENRTISLTKAYNTRTRSIKSIKSGCWRTIPISSELLPRLANWEKGGQARVLREFCQGIRIPSIKFHTLRACFATQLIRQGVPPIQLQKICGWRDLETMQRYIRLAGIEVSGATESLKVMPESEIMGKVVNLFENDRP